MAKCITVLWANKVEAALKETHDFREEEVIVCGDVIRMDLLSMLLKDIPDISFLYVPDMALKDSYEQFLLGQAAASGCGLCIYGGSGKTLSQMANAAEVELIPFSQNEGKKPAKKTMQKKTAKPALEETPEKEPAKKLKEDKGLAEQQPVTPRRKKKEETITPKKEELSVSKENSGSKSWQRGEVIRQVIASSTLSEADRKFFSTPGKLAMLEEVICKSTRDTIKFQLHMMFGDRAGVIEEVITDAWKELSEKLKESEAM